MVVFLCVSINDHLSTLERELRVVRGSLLHLCTDSGAHTEQALYKFLLELQRLLGGMVKQKSSDFSVIVQNSDRQQL